MFRPICAFIGLRYALSKHTNYFMILGLAFGVAVLITVMSVMNGFDEEIRGRLFKLAPEVTVASERGAIQAWRLLQKKIEKVDEVRGAAPFVVSQGLASRDEQSVPMITYGVLPKKEQQLSDIEQAMVEGKFTDLKAGAFHIVLGQALADRLRAKVGDKVTVMIPQANVTPAGINPRFKRFKVSGTFSVGSGFNFDESLAYIHLRDAQALHVLGDKISGFRLKISDLYRAQIVSRRVDDALQNRYLVKNWTQQFGAFFHAIKMEKNMMFLILMLIIGVVALNLVSSLVIIVSDKRSEIAIMRTYGVSSRTILGIFIIQGGIIGVIGILFGLVGGIALASNVTAIVDWLQATLNVELLTAGVYYVDYLPSKIDMHDLVQICSTALILCFLATLYPAWRASRVQPAEALRYE